MRKDSTKGCTLWFILLLCVEKFTKPMGQIKTVFFLYMWIIESILQRTVLSKLSIEVLMQTMYFILRFGLLSLIDSYWGGLKSCGV